MDEWGKLIRALSSVAREMQAAVVLINEIYSFLIQRSEREQEELMRVKTEF